MNNNYFFGTIAVSTMVVGSAVADYAGLSYDWWSNYDGTVTCQIYASFTEETDELDAVFGDSENALSVSASSSFYQHYLGTYAAPMAALLPLYPSLALDSYVTIGRTSDVDNNMLDIGIDWSDFEESGGDIYTDNGTWFATPDDPQVLAGEDLRVLVGNFTTYGYDSYIYGVLNFQGRQGDFETFQARNQEICSPPCPSPSAIALLGLSGLVSRRRRK
ncbi:MAG: hypothetical protein QF718_06390 [Phycisphaerales bacterium]|jgi:MYXO-CTERM domain-containing protein|nr:hypothetical protein [Phycisphaerales bacterium]